MTDLKQVFPLFCSGHYRTTSPKNPRYNCIAWAAHDMSRWWWPTDGYYWPNGAPRAETLEAFKQAYLTLGFEECASCDQELEYEKIAIFADSNGVPTHVARQLSNGFWTSKCGKDVDIEHELHLVTGCIYGQVALILRRRI